MKCFCLCFYCYTLLKYLFFAAFTVFCSTDWLTHAVYISWFGITRNPLTNTPTSCWYLFANKRSAKNSIIWDGEVHSLNQAKLNLVRLLIETTARWRTNTDFPLVVLSLHRKFALGHQNWKMWGLRTCMSLDLGQKMPCYESHFYMPAAVMQITLRQMNGAQKGGYRRQWGSKCGCATLSAKRLISAPL